MNDTVNQTAGGDYYDRRRRGTFIVTYTGVQFNLAAPSPADVRLEDISYALARINRFTGHLTAPLSVLEHQLYMMNACEEGLEMPVMLHDAHEAYLGDTSAPMKQLIGLEHYRPVEDRIDQAIEAALGVQLPRSLEPEQQAKIKQLDRIATYIEARFFMPGRFQEEHWADVAPRGEEEEGIAMSLSLALNRYWSYRSKDPDYSPPMFAEALFRRTFWSLKNGGHERIEDLIDTGDDE